MPRPSAPPPDVPLPIADQTFLAALSDTARQTPGQAPMPKRRRRESAARHRRNLEIVNGDLDHLARQLETSLEQAERASLAKTRLLARMRADLAAPLNRLLEESRMLGGSADLEPKERARVDALARASQELRGMIDRLLPGHEPPHDIGALSPSRPLRVLLADDVEINLAMAGTFLLQAGHRVVSAIDGTQAVVLAGAIDFDVVLMDLRMPGIDGLEATRRIRALDGVRGQVPIIAMTGRSFAGEKVACLAAGMDDHLAKPFTPEDLVAVIERVGIRRSSAGAARRAGGTPAEPDLVLLDEIVFARTAGFLEPETIPFYIESLIGRCESLLCELRVPNIHALPGLAERAHVLAGSASLFGFERLASVARKFEYGVMMNAPVDTTRLEEVLEATLPELRRRADARQRKARLFLKTGSPACGRRGRDSNG